MARFRQHMNDLLFWFILSLWVENGAGLAFANGANADPGQSSNARREFKIHAHYLNVPIKNGAPNRKVTLWVDGAAEVTNEIELADGAPDWWAFIDVSNWRGKSVTLQVEGLPGTSSALNAVEQSNSIKGEGELYREPLRNQFHFSSRRGWNNDPNGLCFYRGEYHLFYQHNPYGWNWGNMHWGHSVSRDLVHWRELGDALMPDRFGPMFSGSAVVDWQNSSGLGMKGHPPLVLIYTAAGEPTVQCIASSVDGRTVNKFSGNPVLKQISPGNRDPKVFWHEPTRKWVMCLYVETNKVNTIHFLSSPNLKDWTVMSHIDNFFECPDFFELPIEAGGRAIEGGTRTIKGGSRTLEGGAGKWVLTAASSEYMVGTFDGTTFRPETTKLPGHRGRGFYAAQTFSDIPAKDGRRIQIGWLQTATPGMSFNQAMTLPLELRLLETPEGPRLTWSPVKELASLRAKAHVFKPMLLQPESENPLAGIKAELVELRAEFEPGAAETIFTVRGAAIAYDAQRQELIVNGQRAAAPLRGGAQRVTIYCDRTALEIFASDGLTYVPMPFTPKPSDLALGLQTKNGNTRIKSLEVYELKAAWHSR